jgi:predicted NACHT family NTPase
VVRAVRLVFAWWAALVMSRGVPADKPPEPAPAPAAASGGSQKPGDASRGEGRLWDAATGKEVCRLKGHSNVVHAVAFLPDGKTVVTASFDQTVNLWDVATGKETATLAHGGGRVYCAAASPDGKGITSAGQDGKIKLWDVGTRKEAGVLAGHTDGVLQLAFSPDGKRLGKRTGQEARFRRNPLPRLMCRREDSNLHSR